MPRRSLAQVQRLSTGGGVASCGFSVRAGSALPRVLGDAPARAHLAGTASRAGEPRSFVMKARSKLVVAAVSAVLVMALAVGAASANRISISHSNLWRDVFRPLRFQSGGLSAASCSVTLEGSFHSATIRKIERLLIGHITHASIGPCETGTATILTETLPWHVQYLGFRGRLPIIEGGLRDILVGLSFQVRDAIFGSICLARATEAEPAAAIGELEAEEAGGNRIIRSLVADSAPRIRCGSLSAEFQGTAAVTEVPGGLRNVLVRLI